MGLCFGYLTDLIQYSKLYLENFFQFRLWGLSDEKNLIFDHIRHMSTQKRMRSRSYGVVLWVVKVLIQYFELYFENFFNSDYEDCQMKKPWFLTIFDIRPHKSLLVLQISAKSDEIFSGISWIVYATFCGGDFWFSVSLDCSAPSKYGDFETGWIFSVLYLDNDQFSRFEIW